MVAQVEYTLGTPGMRSYSVGLVDRLRPDQERGTVTWLANVFRRVFGPFIWIMPSRWDLRTMLTSDYLLYPGMLIWYAMLPLMVLGVIVTGSRVWSAEERQWTLILVWIFLALYFAQYLAINLAYRQRDLMLPFLMLFGFMGLARAIEYRGWTRAYGAYWVALGTVAGGHLLVRALLQTR
jgi:hypothetical protein